MINLPRTLLAMSALALTAAAVLGAQYMGSPAADVPHTKQQAPRVDADAALRFATITITIDPKGSPLAAYQFEITSDQAFMVVGLDNAGHRVFDGPPHYDRSADGSQIDKLIVADFSTWPGDELLADSQAVAVIHVALEGTDPNLSLELTAAADANGQRIDADISYKIQLPERLGQ